MRVRLGLVRGLTVAWSQAMSHRTTVDQWPIVTLIIHSSFTLALRMYAKTNAGQDQRHTNPCILGYDLTLSKPLAQDGK